METAKCANCGEDTGQASSSNWKLYCTKPECKDAAIKDAFGKNGRKKA